MISENITTPVSNLSVSSHGDYNINDNGFVVWGCGVGSFGFGVCLYDGVTSIAINEFMIIKVIII